MNRIADFKFQIKKFISIKILKILFFNTLFFIIISLIEDTSFINTKQSFSKFRKSMIIFLTSSLFVEFINKVSFNLLKTWMCTPINPYNKQGEDILMTKHEFLENNRLSNLHYLQNIIYLYENPTNKNFASPHFFTKDAMIEIKYKINRIFDEFNKKVSKINTLSKTETRLNILKYLNYNFEFAEVFTKSTSFNMLDCGTKLLQKIILILVNKIESGEEEAQNDRNSPNKYISSQQYIIYFLDTLITFEGNLKRLLVNEKYSKYVTHNSYLSQEISHLQKSTSSRIAFILKKNFKQNFLITYGENIKIKIQEFII